MLLLYGKDAAISFFQYMADYKFFFLLLIFLILLGFCWWAFCGQIDYAMFSRFLWFTVFSCIGSFLYMRMAQYRLVSAMLYYLSATLLQSIFVFGTVQSYTFRQWIFETLPSSNINFSDLIRFSGLSNGGGANLSLQLSLGVIAAFILFLEFKNQLTRLILLLAALFITVAIMFVGRTGLCIAIVVLLGFFWESRRSIWAIMTLIASCFLLLTSIGSALSGGVYVGSNSDVDLARTARWSLQLFLEGDTGTGRALISTLSTSNELSKLEFFLGTGRLVNEVDGTNYSGHDSGYVQMLYAMGFPLALTFYLALFLLFFYNLIPVNNQLRIIGILLIFLVFIAECKEPFVFKYTLPFFVLTYLYLVKAELK